MTTPDIHVARIGDLHLGIEGRDEYIMLTRRDDDLPLDLAHEWLLPQVFRDSTSAGGYYCTSVTVMPYPHHSNKALAIIHHRYDV